MSNRRAIVLVDRMSLWSIVAIALLAPSTNVWHFEALTGGARWILRIAVRLRLLRGRIRQVDAHVGQMRDGSGSSPILGLLRDAWTLSTRIDREWVRREPLLHALEPTWSPESLGFHVTRLLDGSIRQERLRVALSRWLVQRENLAIEDALLLVASKPWLAFIADVARSEGLRLVGYPHLHGTGRLLARAAVLFLQAVGRVRIPRRSRANAESVQPTRGATAVGLRYGHRAISLDMDRHSEFFWLDGSAPSRVVLYDYAGALPPEVAAALRERGIKVLGRIPQVTWPALRVAARLWLRIWAAFVVGAIRHRRYPLALAKAMSSLALDFASWREFFLLEGIRVNVVGSNGSSGQVLALDALRGISVNYQYSIANIAAPTTAMTAGETVQLVYSPIFAELMRSLGSPTKRFIVTGPLSDGAEAAAAALRASPRVHATRARLAGAGARFVICFFDENSLRRWDILSSDADSARDYEFLMSWLEEDPDLGLVVKPKQPRNLRERIGRVAARVDSLVAAGRCVIVGEHDPSRDTHAAEAALAADLCIGKLSAGTAALEGFLVGVRSIMVDVDALHDHPLRSWSDGSVVFDGWHEARVAVDRYRRDPGMYPEIGDWSPRITEIDLFRDGKAVERMRGYITRLLSGLRDGLSPDAVLMSADTEAGPAGMPEGPRSSVVSGRT